MPKSYIRRLPVDRWLNERESRFVPRAARNAADELCSAVDEWQMSNSMDQLRCHPEPQ
jgi:hypothetical protein